MSTDGPLQREVATLLGPGGPVARALTDRAGADAGYEERAGQLDMARLVAESLSSGRHALVEAGTGVGKSFAYLVPLLCWAERAGATVAVATSTIALQEQLVRKDLPLLARALPFDFGYALVKGRGNYLCTRRLHRALEHEGQLFEEGEVRAQLGEILAWSQRTEEGSRQDLPVAPRNRVWDLVRAEQGNCLGRACRHYRGCHYQRSRRRAHAARLLVLNHHVLMADLALRRSGASFLPRVDAVVVDEAHDLEDTAAEHLGVRVSARGVLYQLGRLWSARRGKGLLKRCPDRALRDAVDAARRASVAFFGQVEQRLREAAAAGSTQGADERAAPLPPGTQLPDALSPQLSEVARSLADAAGRMDDAELGLEIAARARGLDELALSLSALARDELAGHVRWIEGAGGGVPSLHSAPVDVGPLLEEVLWRQHDAVILTSATLAAGRPASFDFMRGRLGLERALTASIESPFRWERQVRLVVRTDLPDPARAGEDYERALPGAVYEAVRRTRGGAFVLFTSTASMRRTAAALRERIEADGLTVLVQGEALERPALLDVFRRGDAVLFGVASFWQGVDVPGDALRHVVIVRLPFEVPSHPLQRARAERVRAADGDPFLDLSLPAAALRLKQGFGRLIRHSGDEGMVTILDSRIVRRPYGRFLLESLPECPVELLPDPVS